MGGPGVFPTGRYEGLGWFVPRRGYEHSAARVGSTLGTCAQTVKAQLRPESGADPLAR